MEYFVWCHKCAQVTIRVDAQLLPGHTYSFKSANVQYAGHPRQYAVSLIDEGTGEIVAGRSKNVLSWTWPEWEHAINKLQHQSATKRQVIELLSKPVDRISENTLVYIACRKGKRVIVSWKEAEGGYGFDACGFLFLVFNDIDNLQKYIFIDAPFHECDVSPFTWDETARRKKIGACRSRLKATGYTEFRAMTNKPAGIH